MGFVSWGFVVLACWLIDMSYWALKGSELPGACESFIEGVHGQKLLRGSKNVSIGRFCIGEYDENRHHIFGCMQKFSPLARADSKEGWAVAPRCARPGQNKSKCFFVSPTQRVPTVPRAPGETPLTLYPVLPEKLPQNCTQGSRGNSLKTVPGAPGETPSKLYPGLPGKLP